jgi:putative N-acetyltransferase (TIGR04045 family)
MSVAAVLHDESAVAGCREALTDDEKVQHLAVRHRVFVEEQGIFAVTDRDVLDDLPGTIHLVGHVDEQIVGAVRLYPLDLNGARWKGDRLAVLPDFRASNVGVNLVHLAVRTAAREGGSVMVAMIQMANVRYFQMLGWSRDGDVVDYTGQPHQPMTIDLWFDAHSGRRTTTES